MKHLNGLKENIEHRISELQDTLREYAPNHSLLEMIKVDHLGLKHSDKFTAKYWGEESADSVAEYLLELKSTTNLYRFIGDDSRLKEIIFEFFDDEIDASNWLAGFLNKNQKKVVSEYLNNDKDLSSVRDEVYDEIVRLEHGIFY
jgi:LPS O-antigen subunit length determinant protein (WzzB/FepE family)